MQRLPVLKLRLERPARYFYNPVVDCSGKAALLFKEHFAGEPYEKMSVLMMDMEHRVIGLIDVGQGVIDHVGIHGRNIVVPALLAHAAEIAIAHCHPLGSAKPSKADIKTHKGMAKLCYDIGLRLVEEIIIGDNDVYLFNQDMLLTWQELDELENAPPEV